MLARELALGVGKETFQRPLVQPLSHLYQKISTSSTGRVVSSYLLRVSEDFDLDQNLVRYAGKEVGNPQICQSHSDSHQ